MEPKPKYMEFESAKTIATRSSKIETKGGNEGSEGGVYMINDTRVNTGTLWQVFSPQQILG